MGHAVKQSKKSNKHIKEKDDHDVVQLVREIESGV